MSEPTREELEQEYKRGMTGDKGHHVTLNGRIARYALSLLSERDGLAAWASTCAEHVRSILDSDSDTIKMNARRFVGYFSDDKITPFPEIIKQACGRVAVLEAELDKAVDQVMALSGELERLKARCGELEKVGSEVLEMITQGKPICGCDLSVADHIPECVSLRKLNSTLSPSPSKGEEARKAYQEAAVRLAEAVEREAVSTAWAQQSHLDGQHESDTAELRKMANDWVQEKKLALEAFQIAALTASRQGEG